MYVMLDLCVGDNNRISLTYSCSDSKDPEEVNKEFAEVVYRCINKMKPIIDGLRRKDIPVNLCDLINMDLFRSMLKEYGYEPIHYHVMHISSSTVLNNDDSLSNGIYGLSSLEKEIQKLLEEKGEEL